MYDVLDKLIYDALGDDSSPLAIDPKVVQWIDRLEQYEQQQLTSVSDADVQQYPEACEIFKPHGASRAAIEEETTVQANIVNMDQQRQLQPWRCDPCKKKFLFPVNLRRHKWKHRNKNVEKTIEADITQCGGFWEKLDKERVRKIMSIKDAVLLEDTLKELPAVNDMIEIFVSICEELANEDQVLKSLFAFLQGGDECPTFQDILKSLHFLSDGHVFRGTLDPDMQKIVFPHDISMAKIHEQGFLASVGFLLEYCMMKALDDDRIHIGELLAKEEEETKNQMELTSKKKRKKANRARAQKEAELSEKHTQVISSKDKKEHDSFDAGSSQLDPRESKKTDKNMTDKQSPEGLDSSNADAAQSNPVTSVISSEASTSQLNPRESLESDKNMTDKEECPRSHEGQPNPLTSVTSSQKEHGSSTADTSQLNPGESKESDENMTDKKSPKSPNGQDNSNADAAQSNPVTPVVSSTQSDLVTSVGSSAQSNPVTSIGNADVGTIEPGEMFLSLTKKWGDMDDDINDFRPLNFDEESSLRTSPPANFEDQGEWKPGKRTEARKTSNYQPQYVTRARRGSGSRGSYGGRHTHRIQCRSSYDGRETCDSRGRGKYDGHGSWDRGPYDGRGSPGLGFYDDGCGCQGRGSSAGQQNFPQGGTTYTWKENQPSPSTFDVRSELFPSSGEATDWLNKHNGWAGAKEQTNEGSQPPAERKYLKTPEGQTSIAAAETPDGSETAPVTSDGPETPPVTPGNADEETKMPDNALGSRHIHVSHDLDRALSSYVRDLRRKCYAHISVQEYKKLQHKTPPVTPNGPPETAPVTLDRPETPPVASGNADEETKRPDNASGSQKINVSHDLDRALPSYYRDLRQNFDAFPGCITFEDYDISYGLIAPSQL